MNKRELAKREKATHLAHCNRGEYEGSCKYGESDICPALKGTYACKDCGTRRRIKAVSPVLVELGVCPQCYTKAKILVYRVTARLADENGL